VWIPQRVSRLRSRIAWRRASAQAIARAGPSKTAQEAVPRDVQLAAAEAPQLPPHARVVLLEELAPLAIAELGRTLGRSDDVGEEDGGERALRRPHPGASKKRTDRGWVDQGI
jgi:hypothetical protein